MSHPLVVSIPHSLGKAEAVRRLKSGLERTPLGAPLLSIEQQRWSGSGMTFSALALGQTVPGTLDVEDDVVRLTVELPWILQKFATALQTALLGRARLLLDKK
jgi:hypothetical protein